MILNINVAVLYSVNIFGPFSLSLRRKKFMNLNTQNWQYVRTSPSVSLSVFQRTNFVYRTSIMTIYSCHFLSRYDLKIYVTKLLKKAIYLGLSLSLSPLSVVTTYTIHFQNFNNTIYSGRSLYCYDENTITLNIIFILKPASLTLYLSLRRTNFMQRTPIITIY